MPVPAAAWPVASLVLGSPEPDRASVSVLAAEPLEAWVEYGSAGNPAGRRTLTRKLVAGEPSTYELPGLTPNATCTYRLVYRRPPANEETKGPSFTFHTPRTPGSPYVFEIQGDSHPERSHQNDPALYARTLIAAEADRPDFYLTIGDDFSVDTLEAATPEAVARIYAAQHWYLGLIARSAPLFLVNGNHEQGAACNLDGSATSLGVLVQTNRNRHFPQPAPGAFYSGDQDEVPHIGLLRDYYAFTWGDALFVVIDPYWHSPQPVDNVFGGGPKSRDLWQVTLGRAQYDWLARTLRESKAAFKFVFAHHVNGTGRGGVEQAGLFEWGGRNRRGDWEFDVRRPGWELPIHQLMAQCGVTVFFQGHDHLFCRQELDGVIYQELPQPGDATYTLNNADRYQSGTVLPNSGRVRVHVGPDKVRVEYVRSYLPGTAPAGHADGEVALAYDIPRRVASTPRSGAARTP